MPSAKMDETSKRKREQKLGEREGEGEVDRQKSGTALKNLVAAAEEVATIANELPNGVHDFGYYSTLPEFQKLNKDLQNRLSHLIHVVASNAVDESEESLQFNPEDLLNFEDIEYEMFEPLQDLVDALLEKVDQALEEADNAKKQASRPVHLSGPQSGKRPGKQLHQVFKGVTFHADISKPQLKFKDKVDNSNSLFIPRLKEKPHAIIPLNDSGFSDLSRVSEHLEMIGEGEDSVPQGGNGGRSVYSHPYQFEIKDALKKIRDGQSCLLSTVFGDPSNDVDSLEEVKSLEDTTCSWIDTFEQFKKFVSSLKKEHVIAVDLENHSHRSFQGFLCLMQVSTKTEDFLVDLLALREHMYRMNEVFADSKILKVFHGSDFDVLWLQRDFGVYLVNLFDTGQAARVLSYPSAGLAYSLSHHCDVNTNKAYQLADWRIRPLPEDMSEYARLDTHYLLYIMQRMVKQLKRCGKLIVVLERSAEIASKLYERKQLDEMSARKFVEKRELKLTGAEFDRFRKLFEWRDRVSREEDESSAYILPTRHMVSIARVNPRTVAELQACCHPAPPCVADVQHSEELLTLLKSQGTATDTGEPRGKPPMAGDKRELHQNAGGISQPSPAVPSTKKHHVDKNAEAGDGQEQEGETDPEQSWCDLNSFSFENSLFDSKHTFSDLSTDDIARLMQTTNATSPFAVLAESMRTQYQQHRGAETERHAEEKLSSSLVLEDYVLALEDPAEIDVMEGDDVVKVMAEVYRVSNQNRKRNKENKKSKSESKPNRGVGNRYRLAVGSFELATVPEHQQAGRSKHNKDDASSFMMQIGWFQHKRGQISSFVPEVNRANQPTSGYVSMSPAVEVPSPWSQKQRRSSLLKQSLNNALTSPLRQSRPGYQPEREIGSSDHPHLTSSYHGEHSFLSSTSKQQQYRDQRDPLSNYRSSSSYRVDKQYPMGLRRSSISSQDYTRGTKSFQPRGHFGAEFPIDDTFGANSLAPMSQQVSTSQPRSLFYDEDEYIGDLDYRLSGNNITSQSFQPVGSPIRPAFHNTFREEFLGRNFVEEGYLKQIPPIGSPIRDSMDLAPRGHRSSSGSHSFGRLELDKSELNSQIPPLRHATSFEANELNYNGLRANPGNAFRSSYASQATPEQQFSQLRIGEEDEFAGGAYRQHKHSPFQSSSLRHFPQTSPRSPHDLTPLSVSSTNAFGFSDGLGHQADLASSYKGIEQNGDHQFAGLGGRNTFQESTFFSSSRLNSNLDNRNNRH